MSLFTVFGADGFIGRHLAEALGGAGHDVVRHVRGSAFDASADMGNVIFCAGVTADFRARPYDTIAAHVSLPAHILEQGRYDSLLYLSSTRVYGDDATGNEDARLPVAPASPSDLYNISKLAGETLCLNHPDPRVRVARLSNVYGERMFPDELSAANFLARIIGEAVLDGRIVLATDPASAKDYVDIGDVVRALMLIASDGDERLYNVASGCKVSHRDIVRRLSAITGCAIDVSPDAPLVDFPDISTRRLAGLFSKTGADWAPASLSRRLPSLVAAARERWRIEEGAIA